MPDPAERYDTDQERLLRESEGDGEDQRVPIPRAPEVNPEIYKDVVGMLFRGFLTKTADINGALFVFKSLNQNEFDLIRLMTGMVDDTVPSRFWDVFLAHAVFLVDGQNVLVDRQRVIPQLTKRFQEMLPQAKSMIVRHLSELNRRAGQATIMTEAYAYESYSRYRWAQFQGLDLTSPAANGVPGTELLGLNWAQLTWRALNYYEDIGAAYERDWENAKFIGSCMAGKGVQKVYNRDHDRHRKEAEERIARKDRILRHLIEGAPMDDNVTIRNGQTVVVAQTVEQLADQLDRTLRGEKDWHDEVVDAHERRVRERFQQQQQLRLEMAAQADERFGTQRLIGSSSVEGLTAEQVRERMARTRQIEAQAVAQNFVHPEQDPERTERFLHRYGLIGPRVETSVESTDRDPSTATPLNTPREPGRPWRP